MRDTSATPVTRLPQPTLLATRHLPLATVLNVLLAVLLPGCFLPTAFAQTETATVAGRVSDPSGAVVQNAMLHLVNIDKGTETDTKTNGSGLYVIPAVQPGRYRIEVEHEGFKVANLTGLTINVQDNLEENFKLEVGSVSESVTVPAEGNSINTTDGSVGTVIDRQFVANMPLNGRSFQDLISMTPGVVNQSPQNPNFQFVGYGGDFSVNGQRTQSNYYMVDGVSGNSSSGDGNGLAQSATGGTIAATTTLGTTQSLISVDALQEFRVQSSAYSAEYGRSPGGQISFTTRSGTNTVHGSAFDYLRNNYFDANDWFNDYYGEPISALRQNDFGGTLGGPILLPYIYNGKSRTFFFTSYEGLRLTQPQAASIQYVPSTSLRQFAVSTIAPMVTAFPVPTGPEIQIPCDGVGTLCPSGQPIGTLAPSGLAEFVKSSSSPSNIDSTSIRFDHVFVLKLNAFLRIGITPSSATVRNLSSVDQKQSGTQSYTLGATLQLSRRATNEFRLGYSRDHATSRYTLDNFGDATPVDLNAVMGIHNSPNAASFPYININGVGTTYIEQGLGGENKSKQWNIVDSVANVMGHHDLKFGLDYRRIISPLIPTSPFVFPYYSSSQAIVTDSSTFTSILAEIGATPVFNETSIFAQDNWHIAPRLTASFGLRWEIDPPPTEAHGDDAFTLFGNINDPSTLTLAPRGTSLWKTTWFNFAPRLGVAWTVHANPDWQTVVRAGGGVFFDSDNEVATQGYSEIGFYASNYLSGASILLSPSELTVPISTTPPYTSTTIVAFPSHLQLPYSLQWSAAVEQALGKQQNLTLSYVASNGRRLLEEQQLYLTPLNGSFGYVDYLTNGDSSNYQALQVNYQRAVAHGLQALVSYTWSHSIDFGSNSVVLPYQRGNSDFDVRHNLQSGLTWDLPSPRDRGILPLLLGQWGLDGRLMARTGFPLTLSGSTDINPATGKTFYGGVNLVPGVPIYLHGSQYPGGRAVNSAAFTLPAGISAGNAPRNFVRGFGEKQVNLAVRRTFNIHASLKLQFRAETFNMVNHPNFGYVDQYLTDAQFGQATSMLNQSLGTVASQYQQGGPRSMQFALKLLF